MGEVAKSSATALRRLEAGERAAVPDAGGSTDDVTFARRLVAEIADEAIGHIGVSRGKAHDVRTAAQERVVVSADPSFLGQLSAGERSDRKDGVRVDALEDVQTLLLVSRAGLLQQRRAAVCRLRDLVRNGKPAASAIRRISTSLSHLRDVEIGYELSQAREVLPGGVGRRARLAKEEAQRLFELLRAAIFEFWEGQQAAEPVSAMPPDQRAQVLLRLRDAPDMLVQHICALLDQSAGVPEPDAHRALLSSLRYAGDPRLLPSLIDLLEVGPSAVIADAARAICRIEDPRSLPALVAAYERSVVAAERATIGGALGKLGDVRARRYVRKLLSSDEERVLLAALEALDSLATPHDLDLLLPWLDRPDPMWIGHVVRALGTSGDARALPELMRLGSEAPLGAIRADIEDSGAQLRATLELRGEEAPADALSHRWAAEESAKGRAERQRDPAWVRIRSWLDFLIGHIWLGIGAARRGVARFERAAARRRGWALPLSAIALMHARHGRPAQALAAFRRALSADRGWVQRQPVVVRNLARVFLRRAEEVEQSGRVDIARGLVEELLSLDLRRLPSEVRFELSRRHEVLRGRSAP